ncbi:TPA: hypothetical protein G8O67_004792 [Salmonella enterica]|uniref:Uncharacterized protein n=1 Tax=Salmonella enterica TaxID=28901 RepID=A0A756I8X3_SALER|nr:hypothetical protein [Salmonella enterica]EHL5833421.1 hypothetical protein [Salmonella enterica]EJE9730264.1 hypothetical protein [Salmonella enterica]ELQ0397325.1 hypothetical protein [Salmonella enterica]ELY9986958.1 hypothetical protein [Salmonella enterica]
MNRLHNRLNPYRED